MTRYVVESQRSFKVAKNVVGDTRLRLRPVNVDINLFLNKYNLRAINYEIDQQETPPDKYPGPKQHEQSLH